MRWWKRWKQAWAGKMDRAWRTKKKGGAGIKIHQESQVLQKERKSGSERGRGELFQWLQWTLDEGPANRHGSVKNCIILLQINTCTRGKLLCPLGFNLLAKCYRPMVSKADVFLIHCTQVLLERSRLIYLHRRAKSALCPRRGILLCFQAALLFLLYGCKWDKQCRASRGHSFDSAQLFILLAHCGWLKPPNLQMIFKRQNAVCLL